MNGKTEDGNFGQKRKALMTEDVRIETMSRDDCRQLQLERLQTTLNRVYRNVAFYKHALDRHAVLIEKIRSVGEIVNLPFTTKEDLRTSYPYDMFALPLRDVVRIHATSGTTGKAIVVGYSKNDIAHWTRLVARQLTWAGITEHDVVQIGFTYSLFTGGLGYHFGAESIGASVIPASSQGNLRQQITIMKDFKTSTLICSPSMALQLSRTLKAMDINPECLSLKRGIFGSEPWSFAMRAEIEETLRIEAFDSYGISEIMGPGVSGECREHDGLHINEDHFIVEVIDPVTLRPAAPGEEGELVFTTITKEAFPLIRYRTGDRARLLQGPCKCGRTFTRMSRVAGRTDGMIIMQGAKFLPSQLFDVVLTTSGLVPLCRIIVSRKDNVDALGVDVAVSSDADFIDEIKTLETLRGKLRQRIENALGVAAKVSFMEESSLLRECGGKKQPLVLDKRAE